MRKKGPGTSDFDAIKRSTLPTNARSDPPARGQTLLACKRMTRRLDKVPPARP